MYRFVLFAVAIVLICSAAPVSANVSVLDSGFQADVSFPQYAQFWNDGKSSESKPLGGCIRIYVRNTGEQPLTIDDLTIEGISLKRAIAINTDRKFKKAAYPGSIYFSDLSAVERDKLISLGEPVWWKAEPESLAPSATAGIIVRMRRAPAIKAMRLEIRTSGGMKTVILAPAKTAARFESISFSRDLTQTYLYTRHPKPGVEPVRILVDGVDMTASCSIGCDPAVDVTPIICRLKSPLRKGSYHVLRVIYADGTSAISGIRAFADETMYGMWGARPGAASDIEVGRAYIEDMGLHQLNLQMPVIGSDAVRAYMNSADGRKSLEKFGIRQIVEEPGKAILPPWAYYLADEPDTADYKLTDVPAQSRVGCLGQGLIERAAELRKVGPETPNMLNLDMTFKPDNWYTYGQLPDIFAADPYYQTRLAQAYWHKPETIPMYSKATFVYAVGSICDSACAPNPLHLMLNCTKLQENDKSFRFGTPIEKRIELYYALASGAKSISYWWFLPLKPGVTGNSGVGADERAAKALWREIGLLGAEVRTLDTLLARSCPASVPVKAPEGVWVRTLLVGKDSLVVLCVNDDYTCDEKGTAIRPQLNVDVNVTLPNWLQAGSIFELNCRGTHDVRYDTAGSGLNLRLGTLSVTKLLVITRDPKMRERLQDIYKTRYERNVGDLFQAM